MKYYAVIDTNVVVSSMLKIGSIPNIIIKHAISGEIIPLLNKDILDEYREVLLRNEFGFNKDDVDNLINALKLNGIVLDRTTDDFVFLDEDDAVFYEIVLTARKDREAYLITGNIKHYPIKPFVVTPREMLEIIENNTI